MAESRMHESRPISGPSMEIGWPQRQTLLNRSLLAAAFALAALGVAASLSQPNVRFEPAQLPAIALIAGSIWMLLAYIFSRLHQASVSGWMVVLFSLVWLGGGVYLLPGYALALLPAALLPVGFAALLLGRASMLLTAVLTAVTVITMASSVLPPSPVTVTLPITPTLLAVIVVSLSSVLLALVLLPLRGANVALNGLVAQRDQAQLKLAEERRVIEQERDAALNLATRQQQHLDALIDQLHDGAISFDDQGRVVRANAVARQIMADLDRATNPSLAQIETALTTFDRAIARAELVALPAYGLNPEEAVTHLLIDRREQVRLARLRGELLGMLTDDMRNPLTSMVTALDLTLGQNNLPEEVDRVLLGARQSGQRLLELVTMLLEISQIEQGPAMLRRTNTALARVIEAGIAQMSPLAQRGAVTVSVEHAGDSAIDVDAERVQRAFCYLLEQALRNSPPYSIVQVRTRRVEGQLVVQISDQGPGRTSQQSEQILRQGQDERGGSSLGLIYSKLVIEVHGGRVWAESNGGQGSTYSFSLPTERQDVLEQSGGLGA